MTKHELNRFQAILTARVADLQRLVCHRDGIQVEWHADQLDDIQGASERALAVCNLNRESDHLRSARAALSRIREGSFGLCLRCEEEIHPKRLAALPWASFCLHCEEAVNGNPEQNQTMPGRFLAEAA